MADIRRIVTLDAAGTPTTVVELEQAGVVQAVRGSFKINAPAPRQIVAQRQRRYAGGRVVGETHENGSIAEILMVQGATANAALANASAVYRALQAARTDLYFLWLPDGASTSTFYEIRGPAEFDPQYEWVEFAGAQMMKIGVKIPVGPLARLAPVTVNLGAVNEPAVAAVTGISAGDAPSLCDITVNNSGGASAPIWALMGWWPHPTVAPLSSCVGALGIIDAQTAVGLTGWAGSGDAAFRSGTGLRVTTSGAGNAIAAWLIDPSINTADDFTLGEIDVEVWARVELNAGVVSPRLALSVVCDDGAGSYGRHSYTAEFGSVGRPLVKPSSGTVFRIVRLGVVTLPVDKLQPVRWRYRLDGSWAAGSSGVFGLDYLMCVPARARACSKSGVANDSFYPPFFATTTNLTKTIRSDLSGVIGLGTNNKARDTGLGGSLIEFPAGDTDVLLKLSSLIPDDPTVNTTSELLSYSIQHSFLVTPRVHLAK